MAGILPTTAPGHTPPLPEYRIVLLGKARAGKSKVARALLGTKETEGDSGQCILHEGEVAGRRICLVDTPGWDCGSIDYTPGKIKNEIIRSVTLCPPGPHALILVLPIENLTDARFTKELETASHHMELLSERVWKHTMVLFICDGETEESTIMDHVQKARKLLEKCGSRHYVLRSNNHQSQVPGLLQEMDNILKENCGDSFLPEIYYNLFQSQIPPDLASCKTMYEQREEQLKQEFKKRINACENQTVEETDLRKRRGSLTVIPPSINEDDQKIDILAIKNKIWDEMPTLVRYYKPAAVLVMAVIGALIGSVVGSAFGVIGSGVGIVIGIIIAVALSLGMIKAMKVAGQSSDTLQDTKKAHSVSE